MLSRNVELYNFGQDGMSTCAVCGAYEDDYTGESLDFAKSIGSLNAWFVHLSEGVDAFRRQSLTHCTKRASSWMKRLSSMGNPT
ncbi:MAG: hypothetical protein Ct9H90mP16_18620 [Candidatus Poseidoniales archaeon]|nr:MAG: hypothetical protein Ct9H90mP16_18620 [Candidatus Poseidoniales archaeon]